MKRRGRNPGRRLNPLIAACVRDYHKELQNAAETERADCKERLAQRLHNDEGLDLTLCRNTLDLIEAALFGAPTPVCGKCGAELKATWKACPECGTAVQEGGSGTTATAPAGETGNFLDRGMMFANRGTTRRQLRSL